MELLQISVHEKSSLNDDSDSDEDIESDEMYILQYRCLLTATYKHLSTFNMVAGLQFKLVRQKHEIVLFLLHIASITSSWKYDYIEIYD